MQLYESEKLTPNRSVTSEGYLLCKGTPIARIGTYLYGPGETPIRPGKDGLVKVHRTPEEVFDADSMASINGKPMVIDHPDEDINPESWKVKSVGVVLNARRGVGAEEDLLVADLLVTDAAAIDGIESGKLSQLSAGYDAKYEEIEPGVGRQHFIRYNHLAWVDEGRCGSFCSVKDSAHMKKNKFLSNLKTAFAKVLDEAMEEEVMDHSKDCVHGMDAKDCKDCKDHAKDAEAKELAEDHAKDAETCEHGKVAKDCKDCKDHAKDAEAKNAEEAPHTLESLHARIKKLEDGLIDLGKAKDSTEHVKDPDDAEGEEEDDEKEAKAKDEEEKEKTKDAAFVVTPEAFTAVISKAEILAPGIKIPTRDAANHKKTADSLCALKRKALTTAFADAKTGPMLKGLIGELPPVKTMDCATLSTAFVTAAEIVRIKNATTKDGVTTRKTTFMDSRDHIRELNRQGAEAYNKTVFTLGNSKFSVGK